GGGGGGGGGGLGAQVGGHRGGAAAALVGQARQVGFNGALVRQQLLAAAVGAALAHALDGRAQVDRLLGHARKQGLLAAHGLGQRRQTLDQGGVGLRGGVATFLGPAQGAREIVE